MLKKQEKLLITFHTTTEAMAMEHICKQEGVKGRLIPDPRSITAGCGLAWCVDLEYEKDVRIIMSDKSIDYEEIHKCWI